MNQITKCFNKKIGVVKMRKIFENKIFAVIWTVVRIWVGVQWLQAGWGKVTGGFDATGFLHEQLLKQAERHQLFKLGTEHS